jgi:hypothetical protein
MRDGERVARVISCVSETQAVRLRGGENEFWGPNRAHEVFRLNNDGHVVGSCKVSGGQARELTRVSYQRSLDSRNIYLFGRLWISK